MDNWFDGILSEGQATPVHPLESGYKSEMGTKVGTAEILAQQGFQDFVPTVPTVPTEKQSPRNTTEAGAEIRVAIPANITELVTVAARLEGWSDTREAIEERAAIMEYDGGLPRAEAERLASQVNDCMTCCYWQGVQPYPNPHHKALSGSGPGHEPRSLLMGACARHQRPWRVSNVPGDANYSRWHLVGQCGYSKTVDWEQAA